MMDAQLPTHGNDKTQTLRDFTVQVRSSDRSTIIGTGFAVDALLGFLVTCKHVVELASTDPFQIGARVCVFFPQPNVDADKALQSAYVKACLSNFDDDIVLLQLEVPPLPKGVHVAGIAAARQSVDTVPSHEFRSYGFKRLGDYQGIPVRGYIVGYADKPNERHFQHEPLILTSDNIQPGMSGAPVLDVDRNQVVGVIYEKGTKTRRASRGTFGGGTESSENFAVDTGILGLSPFNLLLDERYLRPLSSIAPSSSQVEQLIEASPSQALPLASYWHTKPRSLGVEWVGRTENLQRLTDYWNDVKIRVVSLVGFGGEGKTSLAYHWVENSVIPNFKHDGIFWWTFDSTQDNVSEQLDRFIEQAVIYLGGRELVRYPDRMFRVEILGTLLRGGRFLFVLDGIEIFQVVTGDQYGSFVEPEIARLLELFVSSGQSSFCLLTSRVPLIDLMPFPSYRESSIERLKSHETRELLRKLGVKGSDESLDLIAEMWNGHALALSWIAGDIMSRFHGELPPAFELPKPNETGNYEENIAHLLGWYNQRLTPLERVFLQILSAFREPLNEAALDSVFRQNFGPKALNSPLVTLDKDAFSKLVGWLIARRFIVVIASPPLQSYSAHPLLRSFFYSQLLSSDSEIVQHLHWSIGAYYQYDLKELAAFPTLEELESSIEIVYHWCRAHFFGAAYKILWERIYQEERSLIHRLGAYETALAILQEFFPNRDFSEEPTVTNNFSKYMEEEQTRLVNHQSWLINAAGFCFETLGNLDAASELYARALHNSIQLFDWLNVGINFINLAEAFMHGGSLRQAFLFASQALGIEVTIGDTDYDINILCLNAWIMHLQGNISRAKVLFDLAEQTQYAKDKRFRYLYTTNGVYHAEHLRKVGAIAYARQIVTANLEVSRTESLINDVPDCYRILGDLDIDEHNFESASKNLDNALRTSHRLPVNHVLVGILISNSRLSLYLKDWQNAKNSLEQALEIARKHNYLIHEIDALLLMAIWGINANQVEYASDTLTAVSTLGNKTIYRWGEGDYYHLKGIIERQSGSEENARWFFSKSVEIRKKLHDRNVAASEEALKDNDFIGIFPPRVTPIQSSREQSELQEADALMNAALKLADSSVLSVLMQGRDYVDQAVILYTRHASPHQAEAKELLNQILSKIALRRQRNS